MRRALLVAALALAAPALAQVPTPAVGEVLEVDNFDATNLISYIGLAQCEGTAQLNLSWSTSVLSGVFGGGTYDIVASSKQPARGERCPVDDDLQQSPAVYADATDTGILAEDPSQTHLTSGIAIINAGTSAAANAACDVNGGDNATIYVCVHWANGASNGLATGTFKTQLKRPGAPNGVSAGPGDGALNVGWTAPTTSAAEVDHYIVTWTPRAPAPGGPSDSRTSGSSGEIGGTIRSHRFDDLVNGVTYDLEVCSFSIANNRSETCGTGSGTPAESDDFWELYEREQGAEQGGCASGPAGALALLGVAGLLAIRRRKP
jgi:MYXO-CTERM domain-containing protein